VTEQVGTCVVVEVHWRDRTLPTALYGPFLPHVGSATTDFVREMENREDVFEAVIRDVFVDPAESDCKVVATR
jgi:hypothetical protein